MYVCTYICVCVHFYIHIYIFTYIYIRTHIYICNHIFTCINVRAHVYMYIHIQSNTYEYKYVYVCLCMCMYTHIYTYIYICVYIHIHIYIYMFRACPTWIDILPSSNPKQNTYEYKYVYVYLCMCIYTYMYIYICVYIHIHIYIYLQHVSPELTFCQARSQRVLSLLGKRDPRALASSFSKSLGEYYCRWDRLYHPGNPTRHPECGTCHFSLHPSPLATCSGLRHRQYCVVNFQQILMSPPRSLHIFWLL